MRAIRPGDRGPAVEDVQRRLRTLCYDLGPTGIDGVFLGRTLSAVRSFQEKMGFEEDGLIGDATWSALVDATFTLGDRMLYLRVPHFHGADVRQLQEALSVLGFSCGQIDAIFGAFSERATREFQRNAGLPMDGIVGPETVAALRNLRHIWEGKEARSHSEASFGTARSARVLERLRIAVRGEDDASDAIAVRVVNLAHATQAQAGVRLLPAKEPAEGGELVVTIVSRTQAEERATSPVATITTDSETSAGRLLTAFTAASSSGASDVTVEVDECLVSDEIGAQRTAVAVLDALCEAFD